MKAQDSRYGPMVDSSCSIGKNVSIEPSAIVGSMPRPTRDQTTSPEPFLPGTIIASDCYIGHYVVVERGAIVGEGTSIEHGAVIESGVILGPRCFVVHGARMLVDAKIGEDCIIGGLVSDRTLVGARCRVFGKLVHRQAQRTGPWDGTIEPAPTLEDDVFIGAGAIVVGPVVVGAGSYVCANAIVTKNVPPNMVVTGVNEVKPIQDWKGRSYLGIDNTPLTT